MNTAPVSINTFAFRIVCQSAGITDRTLRRGVLALSLSAAECYADWSRPNPSIKVVGSMAEVEESAYPVVLSDTIEDKNDLALHKVVNGRPAAVVLAIPGWEQAADHEIKEIGPDPFCDVFVQYGKGAPGDLIALENCDAVQASGRPIDLGEGDPILVSNHVTPAWFGGLTGPFDRAGECSEAYDIRPGCYSVVVRKEGRVDILGDGVIDASKISPLRRLGKRLVAAHRIALGFRLGMSSPIAL